MIEYAFVPGQSADKFLRGLTRNEDYPVVSAFFVRQQNAIEMAHKHRLIIGDRWPGNTVVHGSCITFIDLDVAYEGDVEILAVFEEIFALFQSLAHISDAAFADRLAKRFVGGLLLRHRAAATSRAWAAIRSFYDDPEKPAVESSLNAEQYASTLNLLERHFWRCVSS